MAKRDSASSQRGGKIAVLKQHISSRGFDLPFANDRIIVRRRKEDSASHSTRDVLDTEKGDLPRLEVLSPQQGLYILGFRQNGSHLYCLLESFLAAANENLFQCGFF
jgi:hypothetical protein